MYARLFKIASLLVVGMVLSINALAAGGDRPIEETGPTETGTVKATKVITTINQL